MVMGVSGNTTRHSADVLLTNALLLWTDVLLQAQHIMASGPQARTQGH